MEKYSEKNNITIGDVADALGISKTTVSRAISGKGRIGEATRQRVLDYIRENNYKPNPMAKGLADQKTYNICWVVPGDYKPDPTPTPTPTPQPVTNLYTVVKGDTLGGIVKKHHWCDGCKLFGDDGYTQKLAEYNNIPNRGLIYPGQTIRRK